MLGKQFSLRVAKKEKKKPMTKSQESLIGQGTALLKAIAEANVAQAFAEAEGAEHTSEAISQAITALEKALSCAVSCGRAYEQ